MNLSAPFIKRPVMTTFVMIAILLGGLFTFQRLPVSDLPTIEYPNIEIIAHYSGAQAETVLNHVTIPLEKELVHVKGVKEISSNSYQGTSRISLAFGFNKDMDLAIREVQSALNRAEPFLPKDLDQKPTYFLQEEGQDPIMYLLLTSDQVPIHELNSYAMAYILPKLNRIGGVAKVKVYGTEKNVWVKLNPELMAAKQVSFSEIFSTLREATHAAPLGSIQTGTKNLAIELSGSVHQIKEIENLKIKGTQISIKDVGSVSNRSDQEPEFHFVSGQESRQSLVMALLKISDGNTVAISKEVQQSLVTLKKELPKSINLNLWFDKSVWIQESIYEVEWSLVFALVLVVMVIYFSLGRWLEAIIISAALPLSIVGTFIVMYFLEYSLDLLSLLALTLAVGFVVDDAIVVLENIVRRQESGETAFEASLKGSKQIGFTILSMTVSLIAVFIPLLFMEGINGRLFREFSVTLSAAIFVSGFVSLTLTPYLCSRFLSSHTHNTRLQNWISCGNEWMIKLYSVCLNFCFRFPKTILCAALLLILTAIPLFQRLPVDLIPNEDRGFIYGLVHLPSGLSPSEILKKQSVVEGLVQKNPFVDSFLNIQHDGNLFLLIKLLPFKDRPSQQSIISSIQENLDALPGYQSFLQGYQLISLDVNFGHAGQYKYIVRGLDFEEVANTVEKVTNALKNEPFISFAKHTSKSDSPKLVMHFNQELARQYGVSKNEIQELLQSVYGNSKAGTLFKASEKQHIILGLQENYKDRIGALSELYIKNKDGHLIPLKAFATWEEKLQASSLKRREQLPSSIIRFSLAEGVAPNVGLRQVEAVAEPLLPEGISGSLDGSGLEIASTLKNTLILLLAAALVMYIVLGVLYESFIHPLTILSSLPFACWGGVITLYLFDEPLSIFSAVGFLLLIGIVKKNGIMMVDYALEAEKLGSSPQKAIFEGCLVRFRPIMMTTVAAVMGAIPIAVGFGEDESMRRGLGLVIGGGLIFSQLLTLFVTPLFFLLFDKLRIRNAKVVGSTPTLGNSF